jgi:hypothetical protein
VAFPYSETGSSRPVAAAARAIPDLAALIFSAYCNGIRGDFHPPACVIVLIAIEFNHTLRYVVTKHQSIIQTKIVL